MANKSIMMSVEFRSKLDSFLVALNAMHAKRFAEHYENLEPPVVYPEEGLKYIRIVSEDGNGSSRYSYAFIDKSNGDVLKCEGWKKPAKHARGNLFSASNGMEAIGPNGYVKYLI